MYGLPTRAQPENYRSIFLSVSYRFVRSVSIPKGGDAGAAATDAALPHRSASGRDLLPHYRADDIRTIDRFDRL